MTTTRASVVEEDIVRFDIHQRFQHAMMMTSFTLLALTGMPLKFNNWAISEWWVQVWGGIENLRTVHHYAAWVLIASSIYHLLYIGVTVFMPRKPLPISMIPTPKDARDLSQEVRYLAGFSEVKPQFGRFNWREKFDYWAVFWGMALMAGSGLILMYPVVATDILPGWVVPVALVAHSDEALLAVSWIVIVHLFFGHMAPEVFPMNKSIFTGKVPRARYRLEHPLEMEPMEEEARQEALHPPIERQEGSGTGLP